MKKNISFISVLILVFLILTSTTSYLTNRSTAQVVLHSADLTSLTTTMNLYFKMGYRVTHTESQSVGTSVNSRNNVFTAFEGRYRDVNGEIFVVMEK